MPLVLLIIGFSVLTLAVVVLLVFALRRRFGTTRREHGDLTTAAPPLAGKEER